ncbi:MAG: PSD1 and planctomycete cytochrome C domain-containing protein [Verrucomicrobiota bacterium]|nr:PSD1 domain-containing protein [Limisphaerales bacterium]
MTPRHFCRALIATFASLAPWLAPAAAGEIQFDREIQPILADHCFACHGPDDQKRKSNLRLDVREDALKGGKSDGPAIVPGKPEASALMARLTTQNADDAMPPAKEEHPVKPADLEKLRRWIAEGAPYARHWAFAPPVKPPVPAAIGAKARLTPVDVFLAARMAQDGLKFSPSAAPEQLCRRLYLDLIGLPPSPAEVKEFSRAARKDLPAAVAGLTDRLLASEHYGEKWARHWLDAARYADSNGYEKDLAREQWAWRDWVIQSLNRDLPYDQFLIEQIAGDLLPNRSQAQLIATGFLRNGMINEEGAIVPEQFRMEGMFDRLDVIGKSALGLTLQCAQCHSHKFDPISQTEYYGIFAFLNNTYEAQTWVYSAAQEQKIAEVRAGLAGVTARLKARSPDWADRLAAWEAEELRRQQATTWEIVEAMELHHTTELNHPVSLPDKSILTLGHPTSGGDTYMIAEPNVTNVTGLRLEILTSGDLPFGGPGRSYKGTWALSELVVETQILGTNQPPGTNVWERLKLVNVTADFSEPDHALEPEWANAGVDKDAKRTCGPATFLADSNNLTAWRADRGVGRRNADSVAVAQFEKPLTLPAGAKLKFSLRQDHAGAGSNAKNTMIGRFRIACTTTPDPKASTTPYAAVRALQTPRAQRTAEQSAEIFAAWRQSVPEFNSFNDEVDALWKQFPEATTSVLNLAERTPDDARETFRLDRGGWDNPKERVAPQVPAALHPLPAGEPPTRLTFARWLVDKRSPLTARVVVNRVWQAIFGVGIVETAEDFGTRASAPSHPELLDWLAVDFMEHGWSQKQLIRTLVTSVAYRQTSRVTPALLEQDPRNRLLARGPRFRAEAEVVRDIALGTSGLLTDQVGGPSLFPPVPQNVLDFNYVKPDWPVATGPDRYRRALYVFRKRSMPDPALSTFDAPTADTACVRRPRSNTPLAALTSLNEPIFVEASQALALRILREGGRNDAARADYAYRLCTGRGIKPAERTALLQLLAVQRKQIAEGWLQSNQIASGDDAKRPALPPHTIPQDAAAWTIAARVLLNLDETLTKN